LDHLSLRPLIKIDMTQDAGKTALSLSLHPVSNSYLNRTRSTVEESGASTGDIHGAAHHRAAAETSCGCRC
jgi:hypothetical protein